MFLFCVGVNTMNSAEVSNVISNSNIISPDDDVINIAKLRVKAEAGDVHSQFLLGLCYFRGYGVSINTIEASKWLRKAAMQDNSDASILLAEYYISIGNQEMSGKWIQKYNDLLKRKSQQAQPATANGEVATTVSPSPNDDTVYDAVEVMPSFPGGERELNKYLSSNVKYPYDAIDHGIQGVVIVGFVVDSDGTLKDVKVMKGVEASLDKEALRVVMNMPKWIPGKQNGRRVKVKTNTSVSFRLQ